MLIMTKRNNIPAMLAKDLKNQQMGDESNENKLQQ